MEEKLNRSPLALGCFSSLLLCASWPQKAGLSCYIPPPSPYQRHSSSSFSRCAKGTLFSLEHNSEFGKSNAWRLSRKMFLSWKWLFLCVCPESNLLELEMFCLKHLRFDKTLGNPVFLIFEGSTHQTPDVFTLTSSLQMGGQVRGITVSLSLLCSRKHKQWHWKKHHLTWAVGTPWYFSLSRKFFLGK